MRDLLPCPICGESMTRETIEPVCDETTGIVYPRYYFYCPNCNAEVALSEYSKPAAEEYAEYEKKQEAIRMTEEAKRCLDCAYLIEDGEGEWVCDDCGRSIQEIRDDECSANQSW